MNNLAQELCKELLEITNRPDGQVDLAKAALVIARVEYPDLDEAYCLKQLDDIAHRLTNEIAGETALNAVVDRMSRCLFEEEGFKGNSGNYYDPDNSFLNRVLERRVGIPISLSLVSMEVGRRAGVDVRGIGLPGHFVVAVYDSEGRILVDPFNAGALLTEEECRRRVTAYYGGSLKSASRSLEPVRPQALLVRMLRNLKGIYRDLGNELRVFLMIEWILALDPNAAREYKERGMLYENLGASDLAVRDFRKYLELAPSAADEEALIAKIEALKAETSRFH